MKKFFLSVALIATAFLSQAQLNLPDISEDSLRSLVKSGMERSNLSGMALGIIQNGELAFADGFGLTDVNTDIKITDQSVFGLASLSKAFTAAGIGLLVDEGKLDWKDRVIDHLPSFKLYDPFVTREMRIEDLLCHRNGYNTFDGDLLWYETSYDRREVLARFANLAPKHGFRSEYGYQNTMFLAAALVIEEVTGKTWEAFMDSRILGPLGMKNSYTDVKKFPPGTPLAYPHMSGKRYEYQDFRNAIGAVGINSCLADLSIWAKMWINKGEHNGEAFLSEKTWAKIISPHTNQPVSPNAWPGGTHFNNAALGWFVKDVNGSFVMSHSGGLPGLLLNLVIMPEQESALIVLTNGDKLLPFAMTNVLMDQMLKEGANRDWVSDYIAYEASQVEKRKTDYEKRLEEKNKKLKPSIALEDLVGTYTDAMYGQVRVFKEGKDYVLELTPAKKYFTAKLVHWFGNTYQVTFTDPFLPEGYVTFEHDSHGKPTGFKIDLPNPDFHFYNLDFKKD